jgi:hypothetical protein
MKVIPTQFSVFPDTENPIFGERVTLVSLSDEGAGIFVKLTQHLDSGTQEVCLDFYEFEYIMQAVTKLKAAVDENLADIL